MQNEALTGIAGYGSKANTGGFAGCIGIVKISGSHGSAKRPLIPTASALAVPRCVRPARPPVDWSRRPHVAMQPIARTEQTNGTLALIRRMRCSWRFIPDFEMVST
jgi:hypothetical protein